jgi:Bacterial Ig-like domain
LLLLASCANVMAPTGGPSDTTPPKLTTKSIADSSLNFKSGKVRFDFDEAIDANKVKVTSTPFINGEPKISATKKGFDIQIVDSMLQPNTTYRLNFGTSIVDITEGNAAQDLSFCFSTGTSIDSLMISGVVKNAQTDMPDTSAWVTLYTEIENDSDMVRKKPLYATKVNSSGEFKFFNLPFKDFFIYALGDKNNNYLYDNPAERIAFVQTTVLPISNAKAPITLRTFCTVIDTTAASNATRNKSKNQRVSVNIDSSDSKKRTFDITQPIKIAFAKPLKHLDITKVRLFTADSVLDETGIAKYDSATNAISLNIDFAKDALYRLELLDSFAVDTTVFRPLSFKFRTKSAADYGKLKISFSDSFDTKNKILSLMQNGIVVATQFVQSNKVVFNMLLPGNYQISLLNDENANGKWDNGQYFNGKMQPETVTRKNTDVVIKANWDNEISF